MLPNHEKVNNMKNLHDFLLSEQNHGYRTFTRQMLIFVSSSMRGAGPESCVTCLFKLEMGHLLSFVDIFSSQSKQRIRSSSSSHQVGRTHSSTAAAVHTAAVWVFRQVWEVGSCETLAQQDMVIIKSRLPFPRLGMSME